MGVTAFWARLAITPLLPERQNATAALFCAARAEQSLFLAIAVMAAPTSPRVATGRLSAFKGETDTAAPSSAMSKFDDLCTKDHTVAA